MQVNTIGIDPIAGLMELPIDLIDASRRIVQTCSSSQSGEFVIAGRGNIPEDL